MDSFKLNFLHVSDGYLFSQEGKLSIIGIFENVNLVTLPGSLLKAAIIVNFSVLNTDIDSAKVDISIEKKDAKEAVLKLPTLEPKFPKDSNGIRKVGFTIDVANITFKEIGKYDVIVRINGVELGKTELTVNYNKNQKGVSN